MKYLSIFLLFTSLTISAQKVDVLLVGVSHNYGNSPLQDISSIKSKIKKFKPSAFFGEFLSMEDEKNIMDYWCKQANIKRLQTLRKNRSIEPQNLQNVIDSLKRRSLVNPKDYRLKTDLAHAYYLNEDVANGHFQFWQVYDHLRQSPDPELQNYLEKILTPALDVKGRSMTRLKTSEYDLIAFPLMMEFGIKELQPMDCQDYDLNWSASALAFHNKFEKYVADSTTAYSATLKGLLAKRIEGFEKYKLFELSSPNITEWLNTNDASSMLSSGDFYFQEMYGFPDFPKEEMLSQLHWWIMRNKKMCENAVNRARKLGAKKIVVFVGANHRKYMQEIFAAMPRVAVTNINELKSE